MSVVAWGRDQTVVPGEDRASSQAGRAPPPTLSSQCTGTGCPDADWYMAVEARSQRGGWHGDSSFVF